jgi:tripartite-type tricarboxylate transporter receptor subunit TctC
MSVTNSHGGGYGFRAPRFARPRNDSELPRRKFLRLAAAGVAISSVAMSAVARMARAETYPNRPVRLLVGFPAGGQVDIVARVAAQFLSDRLGQSVVVENRPGAGGNIGAETLIKSAPDGYTLFMGTSANAVNATLFERLSYDFVRDITPVSPINRTTLVLEVNPSFASQSVADLIDTAKANPGKVDIASASTGTPPYMAVELLKMMAGISIVHVPYAGEAQMLTDLLGGQIKVAIGGISSGIGHLRAGKLRAMAVTTAARSEALPDVPAISEFLPGYDATGWSGVVAPKGTPAEIVEKLYSAIRDMQADPKFKERLADLGVGVLAMPPAEFGRFIADEIVKWGKVVRFAGLKPE